ncbi:MAG: lysophospholipid acyltransferase family protein [candidate division Zixibacteria bacterium]
MAKLSHRLEYAAVFVFAAIANLLSARMADALGSAMGSLFHFFWGSRKKVAFENIRKSDIGQNFSRVETEALVKRVFQNTGRTLMEVSRLRQLGQNGARKIVELGSLQHLAKARSEGNGCIVLTAHFGNWELLGGMATTLGFKVHFLIASQHNLLVNNFLINLRKEMGVGIISLERSAREVFKVLNANGIVAIVADQHAPSGIKLNFLGREAMVPRGPALFSIRKNAPVCSYLIRRERFDRHIVIAGPMIYPPDSGDEEADIRYITEKYTSFFEDGIRQWPDQWLWTHRRWKIQEN